MALKTGAVIVAAGMSSRMDGFKPMLKIGAITIVQRVILTLRQAGADLIVVVTGNKAELLEKHLSRMGVVCLRNDRYMDSQMFDSAKIGLKYMLERCDRVLFTPVDVPLFTLDTVRIILSDKNPLIIPVYDGKEGHPLLISSKLIPEILEYSGEGGLSGALKNCGRERRLLKVKDSGVIFDADTPEDYQELLNWHNKQLFRPQIQFRLAKEVPFFGPGTALLLKMIKQTESVKASCQAMQLSYSKGWHILRLMEEQLGYDVVCRHQGGASGGYTCLTAEGDELLSNYERFESEALISIQKIFDKVFLL